MPTVDSLRGRLLNSFVIVAILAALVSQVSSGFIPWLGGTVLEFIALGIGVVGVVYGGMNR